MLGSGEVFRCIKRDNVNGRVERKGGLDQGSSWKLDVKKKWIEGEYEVEKRIEKRFFL